MMSNNRENTPRRVNREEGWKIDSSSYEGNIQSDVRSQAIGGYVDFVVVGKSVSSLKSSSTSAMNMASEYVDLSSSLTKLGSTWSCNKCGESFSAYSEGSVHLASHNACVGYDTRCRFCSRFFKGQRGLKIHLAKSSCKNMDISKLQSKDSSNCLPSGSNPVLLSSQVENHSATTHSLCESDRVILSNIEEKSAICWPKMNDEKSWSKFDSCVSSQLFCHQNAEKRLNMLEQVIYVEASNMFGTQSNKTKRNVMNRRQVAIKSIRDEIKNLVKLHKESVSEEKSGIECIIDDLKLRRRELRRNENSRKRRWRRKNIRAKFYKNPYNAAKAMLTPKTKCVLKVDKGVLNEYIRGNCTDNNRDTELGNLAGLIGEPIPEIKFCDTRFVESKLNQILRRKRNASHPGPNQIPYKVYKKCSSIKRFLFKIMLAFQRQNKVPLKWRIANGVFIPKVNNPNPYDINDFRQIALMNVEGKLWWSLVSDRLYKYLIDDNKFIDTSVQKGSIQKMPGCLEHSSMVWTILKDARLNKKSLALIWLDLANAYGSVPHKLIFFALRRYGVPPKWISLIEKYYGGLWGRSSAYGVSSDWHRFERGIFAGCTISVILFLAAFNIILEYVIIGSENRYTLGNGRSVEIIRGFMDDVSILCPSVPETRRVLQRVNHVLQWASMKLKPPKSRSIVMCKGRVMWVEPFSVDGEVIPCIQASPLKTLGRYFDFTLSDGKARVELENKFFIGLKKIDRSDFTGFMKLWTLHHLLIPQVCWELMTYEISITWVENLGRKMSKMIRKWLGVNKSLTNVALFCREVPCPLPLRSLTSIFKGVKSSSYLQLRNSKDVQVKTNATVCKSGSRLVISEVVDRAKRRITQDSIIGNITKGRLGLGYLPSKATPEEGTKAYRKLIARNILKEENEAMVIKAVQQGIQGNWTKWKDYVQRDLTWKSLLGYAPSLVRFCIGVTYDTVASPNNLNRWGLSENSNCPLCEVSRCNVKHILSGCKISLSQGRYRFRHDAVLRIIAHHMCLNIKNINSKNVKPVTSFIKFVKEGVSSSIKACELTGILHSAKDWEILVDLDRKLVFPPFISVTLQRPDIVIISNISHRLILIELSCPCEENFESQHTLKLNRYADLVSECRNKGWVIDLFAIEVGARGYAANSFGQCLNKLGISKKQSRIISKEASNAALKSSFWIWVCRDRPIWKRDINSSLEGRNSLNKVMQKPKEKSQMKFSQKKLVHLKGKGSTEGSLDMIDRSVELSVAHGLSVGIENKNNSCYMSAIFQCLKVMCDHPLEYKGLLPKEFTKVIKNLKGSSEHSISITNFKEAFSLSYEIFKNNSNHDAHEFLMILLENLRLENVKGCFSERFMGKMLSTVTCCLCKSDSITEEVFNDLQLQIPSLPAPVSLLACVDSFLSTEILSSKDGWKCNFCEGVQAEKQLKLVEMPHILVFQLKRFTCVGRRIAKKDTAVSFPLWDLSLAGQKYKLASFVNHIGSRFSGHYTAVVKEGDWRHYNDEKVSVFSQSELDKSQQSVYILFYTRV